MGWAENPDTIYPQYEPYKTISLTQASSDKTLYAIWVNASSLSPISKWGDLYYMQQMSSTACASIPTPTSTTEATEKQLYDVRDGKKYWVAKLKDGNCWMTQNLDYDDPNGNKVTSVSGENGGPTIGDWKGNIDNNNVREYWDPGKRIVSGNTLAVATNTTNQHLLVGNYYSWLSATNNTGKSITTDGTNASDSICPDGWRLPSDTNSKSSNKGPTYAGLQASYIIGSTGSKFLNSPLYFSYGGLIFSSKLTNIGSNGYYWSSTANNSDKAYLLSFSSSDVTTSNNSYRSSGISVRCVAK